MTVRYHNINVANFNLVNFVVQGDGVGTAVSVDMNLPPFNISFNGVPPELCTVDSGNIPATAEIVEDGNGHYILTVTFSSPPPADNTLGVNVGFSYNTL